MTNLCKALAAFQQEVPIIHKDTQGYGYTYADLPAILKEINPLMAKHGLGFTQTFDSLQGSASLVTTLFHSESGESIRSELVIPQNVQLKGMNDFQVLGSAITYLRRYALSAILGLVTDKDNDAAGEQIKTVTTRTSPVMPKKAATSYDLPEIDYSNINDLNTPF
jgi:ERF superfamily